MRSHNVIEFEDNELEPVNKVLRDWSDAWNKTSQRKKKNGEKPGDF